MWKIIKVSFWLGLVVLVVYCGIQLGRPKYKYYTLNSEVLEMVRFEINSGDEIKGQILKRAEELKIPLNPSDVVVEGRSEHFIARAHWTEEVNLFNQYKKTYNYTIDTEKP